MRKLAPLALLIFIFSCEKETPAPAKIPPFVYTDSISDYEGHYYHTVSIGTQIWMAENLKTNHYQNGDQITNLFSSADWSSFAVPGFCMYNNDFDAKEIYGNLYNFRAANDIRNICPVGWHIPTMTEWQTLINFSGTDAGKKLMENGTLHWFPPGNGATNDFGFAALPGGWRNDQGVFENVRLHCYFWSSSNYIPFNANYPEGFTMEFDPALTSSPAFIGHASYFTGCAIRCIKD
ncbi:fibrobacter succinogenes major paralogous domain-containing protein [soil metagenome]